MSTSIEDNLNTQSASDQRSESSSSAQLQSPLRSSAINPNQANYNISPGKNHHSMRQQLKHHQYDGMAQANHTSPRQQRFQYPISSKCSYTGVDKLIMAAMIEDVQANNSHLNPSGRGLGYYPANCTTYAQVPSPTTSSELELYRLLEHANLLEYFGTFLNFGGDDVRQLSDADEDEFLEIMLLVGMTQKPLHVRRLQKALVDWREKRDFELSVMRSSQLNLYLNQQPPCEPRPNPRSCVPSNRRTYESPGIRPPHNQSSNINTDSNQYIPPREILIGAPKRIRLMDSMGRRRSSRSEISTIERSNLSLHSSPKLDTTNRDGGDDDQDDKEIEIMNSSGSNDDSDFEDDVVMSRNLTRANCSSPVSIKSRHGKSNRLRESLRTRSDEANNPKPPANQAI